MSDSSNFRPKTSESFFRNMLEMAPDAMIVIDHAGHIVIVNSQVEAMFGYLREELFGKTVEVLLPKTIRDVHRRHRAGYAVDPHVRPMGRALELKGRRRDGTEFPVEISLSPVRTDSGSFISSVIRDVTERKEMERQIIDARQSAERANKANTAFLAAASHDLRQPVQALSLLNGALRRTVKHEFALEMIDSQQDSLDAMTNLLNSLLDISRLDAGAVKPDIEIFPIQRLADRLSAEFSRQARQKGLEFITGQCSYLVESDPLLLGEVIQNFVSNAIRYTSKGSVQLQCARVDDHLCLSVKDTGVGIAEEDLEKIFAEFHQVNLQGQKSEGFGLGLAIAQRMADLLEHELDVTSESGKGSTFSITVPIVDDIDDEDNPIVGTRIEKGGNRSGNIVLIEDDSAVANALAALMEAEGYVVAIAASASQANALAEHMPGVPDLLISDYHLLDGSTGIEAILALRKIYATNLPAFIVTGDTSIVADATRDVQNCILVRKPVNPDNLLRDVGLAIEEGVVPVDAFSAGPQ